MPNNRILVFSSSRSGNNGYLQTAVPVIKNFLGDTALNIAFIPFASIDNNYDAYAALVRTALADLPHTIMMVQPDNAEAIIKQADVIMVGGGNTFKLLYYIYYLKLLDTIRDKVNSGAAYLSWSAGSNLACPGIGTTNDMPVIQPKSFNAFGFFPFQINPHYINVKPEGYNGETRDQRLEEFMQINPGISIVALPEGTGLKLEKNMLTFIGEYPGVLFYWDENATVLTRKIMPEENISFLL
jgi:dipeptidase E